MAEAVDVEDGVADDLDVDAVDMADDAWCVLVVVVDHVVAHVSKRLEHAGYEDDHGQGHACEDVELDRLSEVAAHST